MKNHLLWKLLAVNAAVIAVVIAVVWMAIDYLAADYFTVLMEQYKISPEDSHRMFVDSIHRYLVQGSLVALALAALFSFLMTRRVLRPLSAMAAVSRRIAAGDYSARVETRSRDEVGQLAQAFNRMADSLEQVERLRRQMVADMAHELRTPLTNIRGYLEALADGVVLPDKETFDMLQQEILRLVRLVEDLNQLTKADAAKAYLRRQAVVLPDLVNQVLELYRYSFDSRGIAIETGFAPGTENLQADPDKLLLILRNLIQNAAQHGDPGGPFRIAAERRGGAIRLTFENDGPALTESDLDLLFERFQRGERSRSRDSGGAGLGLAIVKGLAEAHGGQVGAACEGGRIRIWVELPG